MRHLASLQALAGVPMADTAQIAVTLGATSLITLLDSDSTHNFISEEAARRSGLPLAGYDVVLDTKWLGVRGPIVWDLARRCMLFQHEGHTVCWQGVSSPTAPCLQATVVVAADALLDGLLGAFVDIFTEPTDLPPARGHDHHIILKPDASPVAVRPYRYPVAHKNELERQCAAMIEQGIVHRSDSPFSSSVLLVKKPDGSW
jgi:hypothetical protein